MLLTEFTDLKYLLGKVLHLAPDALHIHVGLLLFFVIALLVRGERPFATAFRMLLALCVVAEVFDLLYDMQVGRRLRWLNSIKDIANAMLWPGIFLLAGRRILRLAEPAEPGYPRAQASSGDATAEPAPWEQASPESTPSAPSARLPAGPCLPGLPVDVLRTEPPAAREPRPDGVGKQRIH